ncbi:hypothetical protein ACFYPG_06525 [Micromonospora sp. NPDC005553]|uniref:hypothetical protein n=1 Tax=Micromonospora sp. NPDC005553 TaxID=3364232 RepID=UPI003686ADE1
MDASVIIAFCPATTIDVGEVIGEVHDATAIVAPEAAEWRALAATYDTVGRLDAASAVLAAYDLDIMIVAGQLALDAGLAGGGPLIELPPA